MCESSLEESLEESLEKSLEKSLEESPKESLEESQKVEKDWPEKVRPFRIEGSRGCDLVQVLIHRLKRAKDRTLLGPSSWCKKKKKRSGIRPALRIPRVSATPTYVYLT